MKYLLIIIGLASCLGACKEKTENPMIIDVNDVRLNVETFGEKSNPCVLLIMGASASKTWWEDDFCRQLADRGRFVIRYDQRDTGQSTFYPPGQPGYGMDELAEDAIAILDYFGIERAQLVGMSLGGKVANIVALRAPDKVSGIVFIASGAWDDNYYELPQPEARMIEYWSSTDKVDWSSEDAVLAHQIRAWEVMNGSGREFDREGTERMVLLDNARAGSIASMFNHANLGGGEKYLRRQGEIKVPVTVIHGTDDPVLPYEHGLYTHRTMSGSRLTTLEGAGHQLHRDDWPVIIDAIIAQSNEPAERQAIFMTMKSTEYPLGATEVELTIENKTAEEIFTGEYYDLYHLVDGRWEKIPLDLMFIDIAHILQPGASRDFTIGLHPESYGYAPGTYRVVKNVNGQELFAEFRLVDQNSL